MQLCTQRVRQAGYIKFLCELCVCEDQGILKHQTVICKRLLEENQELLLALALRGPAECRDPFLFQMALLRAFWALAWATNAGQEQLSTASSSSLMHHSWSWGAHRALCPRCAKSRLFSTTGSSVSSED